MILIFILRVCLIQRILNIFFPDMSAHFVKAKMLQKTKLLPFSLLDFCSIFGFTKSADMSRKK